MSASFLLLSLLLLQFASAASPSCPITATVSLDARWDGGYTARVVVVNPGTQSVSPWGVKLNLGTSRVSKEVWNARFIDVTPEGLLSLGSPDWASTLAPKQEVAMGFNANGAPPSDWRVVVQCGATTASGATTTAERKNSSSSSSSTTKSSSITPTPTKTSTGGGGSSSSQSGRKVIAHSWFFFFFFFLITFVAAVDRVLGQLEPMCE
jgi:hypothetical protein